MRAAIRFVTAAAVCLMAASPVAWSASLPEDAVRYKCYVQRDNLQMRIVYFYSLRNLPERFTDTGTLAKAEIPTSVRRKIRQTHECVREDLAFESAAAQALERSQPQ